MPVDDDTFNPTTPKRFMRNSADNINTRFVAEEYADNDWHFQAGGPREDAFVAVKRRARSRTWNDRQSPVWSDRQFRNATSSPKPSGSGQQPNAFNPEQWSCELRHQGCCQRSFQASPCFQGVGNSTAVDPDMSHNINRLSAVTIITLARGA